MKQVLLLIAISFIFCQNVPAFNSNRAMNLLKKQCSFGPRFPESEGHAEMIRFLGNFLKPIVDTLFIMEEKINHPYKDKELKLTNFFARFNPSATYRIMLMAHWDTREFADKDPNPENRSKPILGANDGASGVAVLLTLAEIMHKLPPLNIGVDLLFVDGEDMGRAGDPNNFGLGTQAFARHVPEPKPRFAICLDMIADQEQHFPIEDYSFRNAPEVVQAVWALANDLGYTQFENKLGHRIMDDHYFLSKYSGIPAIDIIDFDYPNAHSNYWHTLEDIPENCSTESLGVVGTVMTNFIYSQDAGYK